MSKNKDKQQETTIAEKSYTFFIVPFYFDKDSWDQVDSHLDRWQPIKEELYKDDVLYPYIMEIFKKKETTDINNSPAPLSNKKPANGNQSAKKEEADTSTEKEGNNIIRKILKCIFDFFSSSDEEEDIQLQRLKIYEFHKNDKGPQSSMFADRIIGKRQVAYIAKNKSEIMNPKIIPFTLLNTGNFAPHLFVSTTAHIGILTFSIEIEGSNSIDRQIILNYSLHKRNEINKYQCACINPDESDKINIAADELYKYKGFWKLSQKNTRAYENYICWNLKDFVDCILNKMGCPKGNEKRVSYFSEQRMHLFSFHSLIDEEDNITKEMVVPNLLRLARCVNANYLLPIDKLVEEGNVLQTYENMFFASSIEGTAMICIGKKENSEFVKQTHNNFNRQYFLVYLLVLIQRYSLQGVERDLAYISQLEQSNEKSDKKLWNVIDEICKVKNRCYYTDVSIYTHHSQFYHLCCDCMHIPETFKEIGEKVELLRFTIERKMHEIEKKAEQLQHSLNIVVAFLTIAQVMQAVYELKNAEPGKDLSWSFYFGFGLIAVILCIYLWSYNKTSISNFFKRIFAKTTSSFFKKIFAKTKTETNN